MYNSLGEYPITNDLFIEFIQDAKKKSGLYLEYEIEYGGSDMQSKKLVSKGLMSKGICNLNEFNGKPILTVSVDKSHTKRNLYDSISGSWLSVSDERCHELVEQSCSFRSANALS